MLLHSRFGFVLPKAPGILHGAIMRRLLPLGLISFAAASAQSTISPAANHAHAANAGWLDFRPSPEAGVRVAGTCLSGHAYAANFGWIVLGDGSPVNGHTYANNSATDCGVNLGEDGGLSGYAWSGNIGWIAFEQTQGKPRLDFATGKISGHAYAPNLGWIALDTTFSDLSTLSIVRPDSDSDGIADAWEMQHFANLSSATASSNADGDRASDRAEYEAGTNPHDAASLFRIIASSFSDGGSLGDIGFTSTPGRLYRIEHSVTLTGSWSDSSLGTFAPDAGLTTARQIALSGGPDRFVRAVSVLPLAP